MVTRQVKSHAENLHTACANAKTYPSSEAAYLGCDASKWAIADTMERTIASWRFEYHTWGGGCGCSEMNPPPLPPRCSPDERHYANWLVTPLVSLRPLVPEIGSNLQLVEVSLQQLNLSTATPTTTSYRHERGGGCHGVGTRLSRREFQ